MIEDPDPFAIPDPVLARIREVVPNIIPEQARPEDRNEPMPYQRPEGLQPVNGEREFDISVLDHSGPTVKVMAGTWMGIKQAGATFDGSRRAYHALTVANGDKIYVRYALNTNAVTVLAGASVPSNDQYTGVTYRQLATVTIAAGIISISQTLWGPLEYLIRFDDRREFDVEPYLGGASYVSVKCGTWMGIRKTAGTNDALTRSEYFGVPVANGDTVYVELNAGVLSYHAAATVPSDAPELDKYYAGLADVTVTAGVVSVSQYRWGPLEYLQRYNTTYALDYDGLSSTAHTDYWANYKPYDSSGVLRTGYNAVTWIGDRPYQSTVGTITIDGTTLHIIETKVFSRTVTVDSNGGISGISAEFLKATWTWLSDTAI